MNAERQITQRTAKNLVKAIELALDEFERIGYQKKADPEVIAVLKLAVVKAKAEGGQ
mgnify:CR=1 FL=1